MPTQQQRPIETTWMDPACIPVASAAPQRRVLVVDDNPERLRTIGLRLRAAGYRVLGAMDGVMATHVATTERPDLIVLDTSVAGNRGHVLAKRWRSHLGTMRIPIVQVTARHGSEDGPANLIDLVEQASAQIAEPNVAPRQSLGNGL